MMYKPQCRALSGKLSFVQTAKVLLTLVADNEMVDRLVGRYTDR